MSRGEKRSSADMLTQSGGGGGGGGGNGGRERDRDRQREREGQGERERKEGRTGGERGLMPSTKVGLDTYVPMRAGRRGLGVGASRNRTQYNGRSR